MRHKTSTLDVLLAVAVIALGVRLIYLAQISSAPFFDLRIGDARTYHEWALRIARGEWIGTGVFYQGPLYPYFLAVVYTLFGDSVAVIRFLQAVIGAGSCVLLAAAGIALFGRAGAIAGVLLAVYPPAIFMDGLLDKSVLVGFLTAALLYFVSAGHVKFRACAAGVVLGLFSLTRENALLLAIPVFAWFAIGTRPVPADSPATPQRTWVPAMAFLAGMALVLLPVGVRNYAAGGEFVLTTSQFGPNFYIGNHAGATGLYEPLVSGHGGAVDGADAARIAEQASGRRLRPSEVSSYWAGRAVDFIRTEPTAWLRLLARKLALTFNAVEVADTESQDVYGEWSSLLRLLTPFGFGVVLVLAALGTCLTLNDWRRLWWLYAIAVTYALSIVAFFTFARYRFPLVPVLLLLAAGAVSAWRDVSAPALRAVAFAAAILAAVVAYLPIASANARIDRITHYVNVANVLQDDPERWDQAAEFYDKALKASPTSPAAHFGLANLLRKRKNTAEALGHYVAAVGGWPDNVDFRLEFALALEEAGERERALDQLNRVARLRPADLSVQIMIGRLLLEQSRYDDAARAFERALAIDPKNPDALAGLASVTAALSAERTPRR